MLLVGAGVIRLAGLFLFRVILDALNVHPPSILEEIVVVAQKHARARRDVAATVNGVEASGDANTLTINTSSLDLSLTVDDGSSANFSFSICGDQASVIGALVHAYDRK